MSDLNAVAGAAGLSDEQKKNVERLNKALETHKTLLNLPGTVANQAYNTKLTPKEQQDLTTRFGTQPPEEKPQRGWLGTAWHYTGGKVFDFLQAASDFSTRVARTGIIALEEDRNLADAWDRSEKDGQDSPNNDNGGNGGSGSIWPFRDGTDSFYAGGGGGSPQQGVIGFVRGFGGPGGGGNSSFRTAGGTTQATTGSANTGGGGGGSYDTQNSAAGGSGIVVVAYTV